MLAPSNQAGPFPRCQLSAVIAGARSNGRPRIFPTAGKVAVICTFFYSAPIRQTDTPIRNARGDYMTRQRKVVQ
jgi:hypothetical protein